MDQNILYKYLFKDICSIVPELDKNGIPIEYFPQNEYNNVNNIGLNKYGQGPFCKFRVPSGITQEGVYAVLIDGEVKYIGECENFSYRWNNGYGNISPRNCYVGGRSTNCRVNNLILESYKLGNKIYLFFLSTINRKDIQDNLINELKSEWNIKKSSEKHGHKLYVPSNEEEAPAKLL